MTKIIKLATCEKILRKTKLRVKPRAITKFQSVLENFANNFADKTANATRHRKKKTITEEDIDLVLRNSSNLLLTNGNT